MQTTGARDESFTLSLQLLRPYLACDLLIHHVSWSAYDAIDLLVLERFVPYIVKTVGTLPKSKKASSAAVRLEQENKDFQAKISEVGDIKKIESALLESGIKHNLKTIQSEIKEQLAKVPRSIEKAQAYIDATSEINSLFADINISVDETDYEAEVYLLSRGKQIRDRLESIHRYWHYKYTLHLQLEEYYHHAQSGYMRSSIFWGIPDYGYVNYTMPWVRLMELARFPGFDDVMSEIRRDMRDSLSTGGLSEPYLRTLAVDLWQIARTRYFVNEIKNALLVCMDRIIEEQSSEGCWEIWVEEELNKKGEKKRVKKVDILTTAAFSFVLYICGNSAKHFEAAQKAARWLINQQVYGSWPQITREDEDLLTTCLASMVIYFSGLDTQRYVLNSAYNWLLQKQAMTGEWYEESMGVGPCATTVLVIDTLDLISGKKNLTFVIPGTEKQKVEPSLPPPTTKMGFFSKRQIEEINENMPLLNFFGTKLRKKQFSNKRFFIVLHFLKDLIPFMDACEKLGLLPSNTVCFFKKYMYPHREQVSAYLQNKGYQIYPLESLDEYLLSYEKKAINDKIVIIEDGGYIAPKVHEGFPNIQKNVIGCVEQTTKGIREDKKIQNLGFPILSLPCSKLKHEYEPPYVADAAINNIRKMLPDINFRGQNALIIGGGAIGKEIASKLKSEMNVTVFDLNPDVLVGISPKINIVKNLSEGIKNKRLIIGATGETSISQSELLSMEHDVYLVSASSDQKEIGLDDLEALSSKKDEIEFNNKKIGTAYQLRATKRQINLIADGYPINFWATESMPNQVSDLILTLIFLSAIEICESHGEMSNNINEKIVNGITKKYNVSSLYLDLYHRS